MAIQTAGAMRGGLVTAWLFGMGLITWQSIAKEHHPPIPGRMLAASGFFALLALGAEYPPAAGAMAGIGWGVDLAVLLCLLDKACLPGAAALGGKSTTQAAQKPAARPAPHGVAGG